MAAKKHLITEWALRYPWSVFVFTIILLVIALIQFPKLTVDTDPENMLSPSEPVRQYHNYVKKAFDLQDLIVLGFIDSHHPQGVFRKDVLNTVWQVVEKIKSIPGVVARDIIAPGEVDDIEYSQGVLKIEKLQPQKLTNEEEAQFIAQRAKKNSLFAGKLISYDGKQLCIYIPIKNKKLSHKIAGEIEKIIAQTRLVSLGVNSYITGLPVAEDTFGVEMFKQMALSSPLAMLLVILLIYFSLKKWRLSFIAMSVPFASILISMGALIGLGYPLHIMSSMIPIFIIPITIGDGVHVLSAFHDVYQKYNDRTKALRAVLSDLWSPILYTSLTTSAGFASLATTPIPPVQVFGLFTALGVMCAWFFSLVLIPAFIQVMPEKSFQGFGIDHNKNGEDKFSNYIYKLGQFTVKGKGKIFFICFLLILISIIGLLKIKVNDNPVRWFAKNHKIRIADYLLNKYFGGTYMAYLVFEGEEKNSIIEADSLLYLDNLQQYISKLDKVGKVSSIVDIIKKISYELHNEQAQWNTVPKTRQAANQYLFLYQNSGDPSQMFKFIDYEYRRANFWLQLKSGDNVDMMRVKNSIDEYIKNNPLPHNLKHNWAGLTYVNVVWQEKMVKGMFFAFLGSFLVVFILVSLMFRSLRLGFIAMVPMTLAVIIIYGIIGLVGKDYDMPVAVLSALVLGLSVDFAIHFIQHSRNHYKRSGNWQEALLAVFHEPARAIARVIIVVGIAFLPLLFAPLIPYKTVGIFMAAVTILSGLTTLLVLPAIIALFKEKIFLPIRQAICAPQAFYLFLGILFLISSLAGFFINRWFFAIIVIVALGLIQASFTGFCLIMIIIEKMGFCKERVNKEEQ